MQQQLTWWVSDPPSNVTPAVWEQIDKAQQQRIVSALARLIVQTIELRPQNNNTREEDRHEF